MKNTGDDTRPELFSSEDAGRYLDRAIPLSIVIAGMKTALLGPITNEIVSKVERNKNKNLNSVEKEAFEKVIRDIIANLPPSVCGFDDPDWQPSSVEEVQQKLDAVMSKEKQVALLEIIINKIKNSQTRMAEYFN